jgi:hypothetical protein
MVRCEDFFNKYFLTNEKIVKKCTRKSYRKKHPEHCKLKASADYCEDLVGFPAHVTAKKITPWGRKVYRWGVDHCN